MLVKRIVFQMIMIGLLMGCVTAESEGNNVFPVEGSPVITPAKIADTMSTPLPSGVTKKPIAPQTSPTIQQMLSATATSTMMPTRTLTITPTPTRTITSQPTDTIIWTPTPLPTIPAEERETFVRELMERNVGCDLPCWWGAVPGETTWASQEPFFFTFADEILLLYNTGDKRSYSVTVFLPNRENLQTVSGATYVIQEELIKTIRTNDTLTNANNLPLLLSDQGVPDEVWLSSFDSSREQVLRLYVVYAGGIMAYYEEWDTALLDDQNIFACFGETDPWLWLQASEEELTFVQARQESGLVSNDLRYLSLQEATGLTVQQFYEKFSNPESPACLETPAELWPPA